MEIKETTLSLSDKTSLNLLRIGEGKPRTFLLSGLHGNEKTGQQVIARLLDRTLSFTGALTILPIANPSGFADNRREETITGIDLNRAFLDANEDTEASMITIAIVDCAKQHDYVIDLHNFSTAGLIQALSNHVGFSDGLALQFKPDVIRTSPKETGLKLTGTLAKRLKEIQIPYVLIEAPVHDKIKEEQVERIVDGILRHLDECSAYDAAADSGFEKIPKVVIRKVQADSFGTFVKARLALGQRVLKDEVLGEIHDSAGKTVSTIYSAYSGIVCEMDGYETMEVKEGDVLLRIGEGI